MDDTTGESPDQLPLLDVPADVIEACTRSGQYTGDTWARLHPDRARTALELRARGMGLKAIARTVGASVNTIMAWVDRRSDDVETIKQGLAHRSRSIAGMCLEQIAEDLEQGKLRGDRAAVTFGILVDKSQLLEGQATSIVQRQADGDPHKAFADFIESLPEANARERPAEMRSGAAGEGQTREGGGGSGALPAGEPGDGPDPGAEGGDGSEIRCDPEVKPAFDPGIDPAGDGSWANPEGNS